jgi:hypothetical protein
MDGLEEDKVVNPDTNQDQIDQTDSIENLNENEELETTTEIDESSVEQESNKVPISTFLEYKNENKKLKSRLAELEDAGRERELQQRYTDTKQSFIAKGYDDEMAETLAKEFADVYAEIGKVAKTRTESILDSELKEISRETEFSDIQTYAKEIKSRLDQSKKAGLPMDAKTAYISIVGAETFFREARIKNQAINRNTPKDAQPTTPTANSNKAKKIVLDDDDAKALQGLQKMQPSIGWTAEKYLESRKQ